MKKSVIWFALTALFAAACADAPADEAPAEADAAFAGDAEAGDLDAAKVGGPVETDAKCKYTTCMFYCTQNHTFTYCHSLCSKCDEDEVFLRSSDADSGNAAQSALQLAVAL